MGNSTVKYKANPNYIFRKIAGKRVLISVGDNIANFNGYIQLNDTASYLWQQLAEPRSVEELVFSLVNEFEVTEEEAEADINEFLSELAKKEMVSKDE